LNVEEETAELRLDDVLAGRDVPVKKSKPRKAAPKKAAKKASTAKKQPAKKR